MAGELGTKTIFFFETLGIQVHERLLFLIDLLCNKVAKTFRKIHLYIPMAYFWIRDLKNENFS